MSTGQNWQDQCAAQVRVLRIIVTAITLGPLVYLGVVLFALPPGGGAAGVGQLSFTYLACGMAVVSVAAWAIAPSVVARKLRRQIAAGTWPPPGQNETSLAAPSSDAGKLCAVYQVRTIIAIAILEGAAFFLVFAYQQHRDPWALGVAVLLMVMIAAHLPTRARVAEWVERQLLGLEEDRQLEQFRR
ncbi:MAG TPA: hypothetical protein VFI31_04465 [Pirellulales bacterium]|nr:hypothetical protein [Pirellulales bacterium]